MSRRNSPRAVKTVRTGTPVRVTVDVHRVGDRGDGIALHPSIPEAEIYVRGALAGETVRLDLQRRGRSHDADLIDILRPSPDRVVPPCPHAGLCGGCDLQHMSASAIAQWKRSKVANALRHRGFGDVVVRETRTTAAGSRRRFTIGISVRNGRASVGLRQRASHTVVDVPSCRLPTPRLLLTLEHLRTCAARLAEATGNRLTATACLTDTDTGVDVLLRLEQPLSLEMRETLAAFAADADLARVSVQSAGNGWPEPICVHHPPTVRFGSVAVGPPPGTFLQPSAEGERILRELVLEALSRQTGINRVADLFCGLGTFAIPLSEQGYSVTAFEADRDAVAALERACPGLSAFERDLFRDPLTPEDLSGMDAVVLDPPRAGAYAQVCALKDAGANPTVVIMVSCAAGTFARDARVLTDAGFSLTHVTPVDQFPWSHHVELVGVFERA